MNVAIVGGTGFIGRNVTPLLTADGHRVTIVTRSPDAASAVFGAETFVRGWDPSKRETLERAVHGHDAVVNLAGAPLAQGRWTPARKRVLRASRIETTRTLVHACSNLSAAVRPTVFLSASGIGYYGCGTADASDLKSDGADETTPPGTGFLADLSSAWEREAFRATDYGIRTICLRLGMVLGKDGGALPAMLLPFKAFLGGTIGNGTQPVSWIHAEDLGRLLAVVLTRDAFHGPLNAVSPHPVTMKEFCVHVGKALGRPSWLPVPAWALKIALGELSTLMTHGQSVRPLRATQLGFAYTYPDAAAALAAILGQKVPATSS